MVPLPSLEWFLDPHCNAALLEVALWGPSEGEMNRVKILRRGRGKGSRIGVALFKTRIKFMVRVMAWSHKQGGRKQFFSAAERTVHVRVVEKRE